MRKIVLSLAIMFTAAPALAASTHCGPHGCTTTIRPW